MGIAALVKKAREKQRLANTQEAKVARAQEKVRRAETKAQLEKAKNDLEIARLSRQRASISAQIALERAKTEVVKAQTARQRASDERLKAKFQRAKTAAAPLTATGKVIGRGLAKTAHYLWDEPTLRRSSEDARIEIICNGLRCIRDIGGRRGAVVGAVGILMGLL